MATTEPLKVGLVGAGPWANFVHGPVLAAGPETTLAGVWARRPEAAESLASKHGAPTFSRYEELLDACDAVAFCVPPAVQVDMAIAAAAAGKAVLLEKPLAETADEAARLADAVGAAGVGSLVVLSYRFGQGIRDFLASAADFETVGARATFISGAFLGGPFSQSPWRHRHGALLDVGPHVIDLIDAAVGPVAAIESAAENKGWISLQLRHQNGAVSDVAMSASVGMPDSRTDLELYGPTGALTLDARATTGPAAFATLRAEFAEVARTGASHPCDVHRGRYLQEWITRTQERLGLPR